MITRYQIDVGMFGPGFAGQLDDLRDFVPHLAAATERPEEDFLVRQHVNQWPGATSPSEHEWNTALEEFVAARPELFPEVF